MIEKLDSIICDGILLSLMFLLLVSTNSVAHKNDNKSQNTMALKDMLKAILG